MGSTTPAPVRPLSPNFEIEIKSMSRSSKDVFSALQHWHQQVRTARHDIQPSSPSRSDLMRELKSNMSELDNITGKLREKLSISPPRIDAEKNKSPSENRSTDEEFLHILEKARALLNSSENTTKSPDSSLTDFLPRRYDETLTETIGNCDDKENDNTNDSNISSKEDDELNDTIQDEEKQVEDDRQNNEPNAYAAAYTEENSRDISWISSAHHSKSQDMLNTDVELNGELDLEEELQSNSLILMPKSLNNVSDVDFSNWDIGLNTMAALREEKLEKNQEDMLQIPTGTQSDTHAEEDNSQKTVSSPRTIIESDLEKKTLAEKTLIEEKEEASRKSSSSTLPSISLPGLPDEDNGNEGKIYETELSDFTSTIEVPNGTTYTDDHLLETNSKTVRDEIAAAGLEWSSEEDEKEMPKEMEILNQQLDSEDSQENAKASKPEEILEEIDPANESDETEEFIDTRSSISSIRKEEYDALEKKIIEEVDEKEETEVEDLRDKEMDDKEELRIDDIEEKENKEENRDEYMKNTFFTGHNNSSNLQNKLKEITPSASATMPNILKVREISKILHYKEIIKIFFILNSQTNYHFHKNLRERKLCHHSH